MKKIILNTSLMICLFGLQNCASRRLVFQAEAVSMTRTDSGQVSALKIEDNDFEEKWCPSDEPAIASSDEVYGMADQVIYKAQGGGKSADYITGATIYIVNDGCAVLTGKRAKL